MDVPLVDVGSVPKSGMFDPHHCTGTQRYQHSHNQPFWLKLQQPEAKCKNHLSDVEVKIKDLMWSTHLYEFVILPFPFSPVFQVWLWTLEPLQ